MLAKLGIGPGLKGKKDLRGKRAIFFDDGTNPYRAMCFTVAAKILKRRGAEIETAVPGSTEAPHVKIVDLAQLPKPAQQPKPGIQRSRGKR
jgi:hypothetical protein